MSKRIITEINSIDSWRRDASGCEECNFDIMRTYAYSIKNECWAVIISDDNIFQGI